MKNLRGAEQKRRLLLFLFRRFHIDGWIENVSALITSSNERWMENLDFKRCRSSFIVGFRFHAQPEGDIAPMLLIFGEELLFSLY